MAISYTGNERVTYSFVIFCLLLSARNYINYIVQNYISYIKVLLLLLPLLLFVVVVVVVVVLGGN